jgi:maltose/moltooligosaccharide transporter
MEKRKLGFWEIWNMSFGFLGIQFGFALQGGFMSRIFQTLGANVDDIPGLWIAAPLTGLLVQPIVGYLSDNTWSPRYVHQLLCFSCLILQHYGLLLDYYGS